MDKREGWSNNLSRTASKEFLSTYSRARITERTTTIIRSLRQWVSCIPCGCVMASTCSPWRNTSRRGKKALFLSRALSASTTTQKWPSLSLQSFQLVQHNNHEACELVPCSFGPTGQVSTPIQKNKMNCMKHCGKIIQFSKYHSEQKLEKKKDSSITRFWLKERVKIKERDERWGVKEILFIKKAPQQQVIQIWNYCRK